MRRTSGAHRWTWLLAAITLTLGGLHAASPTAHAGAFTLAAADLQPVARGGPTSAAKGAPGSPAPASAPVPVTSTTTCSEITIAAGTTPSGGYLPLSSFGTIDPLAVGDDYGLLFNVPDFVYDGITYNKLTLTSNGYIEVGDADSSVSILNQEFPSAAAPNNMLAPYWTDLNPGAGGAIRISTITDGTDTWIVVDWEGVPEFSAITNVHSFQVWIGIATDTNPAEDISFAYGENIGNGDGGFLTVGAENAAGDSGALRYYNGAGVLPVNGTQLRVNANRGTTVANIVADRVSGPAPLVVNFDATSSTDETAVAGYSWDFNDLSTSTAPKVRHAFAAGSYYVTMAVTDNLGNECTAAIVIQSLPGVVIKDKTIAEGDSGKTGMQFVLRLSATSNVPVSVRVRTSDGSALQPSDYLALDEVVTFAPGELTKRSKVRVIGDSAMEGSETFSVALSDPVNVRITDEGAVGTITNDD